MKVIYIILGFLCVGLGVIGAILPGLPTTPFLLLALYCFTKGSERVRLWFIQTKLYKKYLQEYDEKRAMTMKQKITIFSNFLSVYAICLFNLTAYWWENRCCSISDYSILVFLLQNENPSCPADKVLILFLSPRPWVCRIINFGKMLEIQVGINLCSRKATMPQ